ENMQATDNTFIINAQNNRSDKLLIETLSDGGRNQLKVLQSEEKTSEKLFNELGLAVTPSSTPDDYFIPSGDTSVGQNPMMLAIQHNGKYKNWWGLIQDSNSYWTINSTHSYDYLYAFQNNLQISETSPSGWSAGTASLQGISVTDSQIKFNLNPSTGEADKLHVSEKISGGNNTLVIHYVNNDTTETVKFNEYDIISESSTSANMGLIKNIRSDNEQLYKHALGGLYTPPETQWTLISMRNDSPWTLTGNRRFDTLKFYQKNSDVNLSSFSGNSWFPHTLSVDYLYASNTNFNLVARPQTGESDQINISKRAFGKDNIINVDILLNDQIPFSTDSDLVLARAPVSTSDNFFTVKPVSKGLSIYKPVFDTFTEGISKEWRLIHSHNIVPVTDLVPAKTVLPLTDLTPAKTVIPMTDLTSAKTVLPLTDLTPAKTVIQMTDLTSAKTVIPPREHGGTTDEAGTVEKCNPRSGSVVTTESMSENEPEIILTPSSSFFTREDNLPLLQKLNSLVSLSTVSFVQESNQLNKRLGDIRQLNADIGFWLKNSAGHADYQGMKLNYHAVQMGGDKKSGNHLFGVMGSYTQGHSSGEMGDEHKTGGIGFYWSWVPNEGPFIDVIGKYLITNKTLHFPEKVIDTRSVRTQMLMGSIQAGWHASFYDKTVFIEPSVELLGGRNTGFALSNNTVKIRQKDSTSFYSKPGVAAGVNWSDNSQHVFSFSAGLFRLQQIGNYGTINLADRGSPNDRWTTRQNQHAGKDNRWLTSIALNTRVSENWRIYTEVESSFGGELHHNWNGQLGFRYQF
ncbi:autotransporter outer membrane beta-barrel domain-containing protein, partial [Salmonella enterica]